MSQMTEEWVLFWYQCLSQNQTYVEYCSAVERQDLATCERLSKKFPLLPGLFEDFGPALGWPQGGVDGDAWKAWFSPKRHLFLHVVEQVRANQPTTSADDGYILLKVPLKSTPEATSSLVSDYLFALYAMHSPTTAPAPKYQLHTRRGRVACGYEQVRQAVHTSTVSYAIDEEGNYVPTMREVTLRFLRGELKNLGWNMDDEARKQLEASGTLDEDTYENFKVRVNKCRRDFKALSQNALHGRFPDVTERSDSEVMDQFWGE